MHNINAGHLVSTAPTAIRFKPLDWTLDIRGLAGVAEKHSPGVSVWQVYAALRGAGGISAEPGRAVPNPDQLSSPLQRIFYLAACCRNRND